MRYSSVLCLVLSHYSHLIHLPLSLSRRDLVVCSPILQSPTHPFPHAPPYFRRLVVVFPFSPSAPGTEALGRFEKRASTPRDTACETAVLDLGNGNLG